jgi:hypothetical protein
MKVYFITFRIITINKIYTEQIPNPFTLYLLIYNVNSSSNTVYVLHEEGYGGCNILGVFSTLQKAESFKRKFKGMYPNKYSPSSDFWNIRITEARLDSEEKYQEEAEWIWNEFNYVR